MKQRVLILLVAILALFGSKPTTVDAKCVTESEALAKAQQFMNVKFKTGKKPLRGKNLVTVQKNIYVFNAEDNGGFVVVSGDDRTTAILGYADRGELDVQNLPCNVKWLLDSYDRAIGSLGDSNVQRASTSRTAVEPLLDTQWGQGSPYNSLCPQIGGEQCVTGCVATAMAQIVNYNRWPQEATTSIPAYTSQTNSISMPALSATTFDWNNMGSTAIARLMLYCGQSVTMDYGTGGSGAAVAEVPSALKDVFGYSKSVAYKNHSNFSDSEWDEMLYGELKENRPVLFGGQSTSSGHAFVVDGYADGKYHINWGWSGYCDGYFTLDDLNPTGNAGYNSEQEMVCNIAPPASAGDITRPKLIVTKMTTGSSYLERASASADFASLTIGSALQSDMSETVTIQVGFALYDDNGLVKVLSSGSHEFTTMGSYTYEASVTIDNSIPQGEYRLVAVNRSGDSDEWLADAGSSDEYISVTVGVTGLTLLVKSKSGSSSSIDFGVHTIDGVTYSLRYNGQYTATVEKFNGTENYSGTVYVPDNVNYQNITFNVNNMANYALFSFSPELTSLSLGSVGSGKRQVINTCPKLNNLELREGLTMLTSIYNCPLLTSLTFPTTFSTTCPVHDCSNLRSITFNNKEKFTISYWSNRGLWSNESNDCPSLTDIYFKGGYPPVTKAQSGSNTVTPNANITIHIPNGTMEIYKASEWKEWNLVDDLPALDETSFIRLDYCGSESNSPRTWLQGCGENELEFAMRIPSENIEAYKGAQIKALEFKSLYSSLPDYTPDYVFITTEGKDYIVKQNVNNITVGAWNQITLDQPYIITGETLFIGFGRKGGLGASFANSDVVDDGYYLRVMGNYGSMYEHNKWIKHGDDNARVYPLFIRAIVKADTYPTDIVIATAKVVELDSVSDGFVNKQVRIKLKNRSPRLVKRVTLGWNVDGKKQGQQTFDVRLLTNHETIVYVNIPDGVIGRNHTMTINVVSIDGEADAIPSNSEAKVDYSVPPSTFYPRKTVMENIASTESDSYIREWITTNKMEKMYPDNFITISVHLSDKMVTSSNNYLELLELTSHYVRASINRIKNDDTPWPFSLDDTKDKGVAQIKASATFKETEYKVNVNTETTFGFNDDGSTEYRIAYVLVEDSVGPYSQYNSVANREDLYDSDYWGWWAHQGKRVEMLYDNVAREIYDDFYGVPNLLPLEITEGETYKSCYTLTLPDNIQNVKNLSIVTLLIDNTTGEILNADKTNISGVPYTKPYYSRKIVMEEGTGTWCGWCPRGIASIERMNEKYPDNFIPIAIHRSDKMSPEASCYNAFFSMVSGYPTSYINRTQWMDPSSILNYDMDSKIGKANASIKISAAFDSSNSSNVNVSAESVFNFSNDTTEYRIAYVLLEDNVGPYNQTNNYSNPSAAEDASNYMNWWIHQGSSVSVVYNDVARKIYDDYHGVAGQLPKAVKAGETYKSSYSLVLPSNIQNAKNLKVVALLLDTSTGEILNADRTAISGTAPSGIYTAVADTEETFDVYNILGVKVRTKASSLEGLSNGVYIVNGKKIIVK